MADHVASPCTRLERFAFSYASKPLAGDFGNDYNLYCVDELSDSSWYNFVIHIMVQNRSVL